MIAWSVFIFAGVWGAAQSHELRWNKTEVDGVLCRKDTQYRLIYEEPLFKKKACRVLKSSQISTQGFFQDSEESRKCIEQSRNAFQELGWSCEERRVAILRQAR